MKFKSPLCCLCFFAPVAHFVEANMANSGFHIARIHVLTGIKFRIRSLYMDVRGTKRAENAQGTPTKSHISSSMLVYEDKSDRDFSIFSIPRLDPDSGQAEITTSILATRKLSNLGYFFREPVIIIIIMIFFSGNS